MSVKLLQVGIRIVLETGVEYWKAVELDADDPDGTNRFVVQNPGNNNDPMTGQSKATLPRNNTLLRNSNTGLHNISQQSSSLQTPSVRTISIIEITCK